MNLRLVAFLVPLACAGSLVLPGSANAQASHFFVSLGAGATELSGGMDWVLPGVPVALGAEAGLGNLFWTSGTVSYVPFAERRGEAVHPFVRLSVTGVGSSPYNASGLSLGGGVALWSSRHIGLRVEALKFWPTFSEGVAGPGPTVAPSDPTVPPFEPRLWAARIGLALH